MCCVRFTMSLAYRKAVEHQLKTAQHLGNLRQAKYLLAILAVVDGQSLAQIALILRVHEKTFAVWVRVIILAYGSGVVDSHFTWGDGSSGFSRIAMSKTR
jgi:hypothetical protein